MITTVAQRRGGTGTKFHIPVPPVTSSPLGGYIFLWCRCGGRVIRHINVEDARGDRDGIDDGDLGADAVDLERNHDAAAGR